MAHIICDPETLGGKPIIEGTRISVEHVLGLLAHGMSSERIVQEYPELTVQDVRAALSYAAAALSNDVVVEVRAAGAAG